MKLNYYITRWIKPSIVFMSQYGEISNYDWLRKEKNRINKDPDRNVCIIKRGSGKEREECLVNTEG